MRLGIYVQVPFCQTKCTYCNFHTGVFAHDLYSPYAAAACREIAKYPDLIAAAGIAEVSGATVDTIYVGGGTPSLLEPSALARVLDAIRTGFDC
jgi:oxygen-independent coproporphyrinogen III oxidase